MHACIHARMLVSSKVLGIDFIVRKHTRTQAHILPRSRTPSHAQVLDIDFTMLATKAMLGLSPPSAVQVCMCVYGSRCIISMYTCILYMCMCMYVWFVCMYVCIYVYMYICI